MCQNFSLHDWIHKERQINDLLPLTVDSLIELHIFLFFSFLLVKRTCLRAYASLAFFSSFFFSFYAKWINWFCALGNKKKKGKKKRKERNFKRKDLSVNDVKLYLNKKWRNFKVLRLLCFSCILVFYCITHVSFGLLHKTCVLHFVAIHVCLLICYITHVFWILCVLLCCITYVTSHMCLVICCITLVCFTLLYHTCVMHFWASKFY